MEFIGVASFLIAASAGNDSRYLPTDCAGHEAVVLPTEDSSEDWVYCYDTGESEVFGWPG